MSIFKFMLRASCLSCFAVRPARGVIYLFIGKVAIHMPLPELQRS